MGREQGSLRRWLMGLTVVLLIPALLLGLLELGLRVAGFGYSARFFERVTEDGGEFLVTNHRFTYRFFPQALARTMVPYRIRAEKDPDTCRIFIFGESAANGDPEPAYSFGRHLEILLEGRFPGTDFEVICTAITAINSHVILPIARECAKLDGDLWIVYMGNNEVIGPYGPGTVFGAKAPPLPLVRASLAIKKSRIAQLVDELLQRMGSDTDEPEAWGGINMFTENLLRAGDPARLRVVDNFRDNLDDILRAAEKAGVPVLLSTVASNLRNCSPFASLHSGGLDEAELSAWEALSERGATLEAEGSHAQARLPYQEAAAIDPGFAELQFRLGRSHAYAGEWEAAAQALARARDTDALAVRADAPINRIIREAAAQYADRGVALIDSEALLRESSPRGLPGRELFYEHVHFTLQGNFEMARIFAERVAALLPPQYRGIDRQSWPGAATCQRKLAVTLWDKQRLWAYMGERLSTPPFTSRSTNAAELAHCQEKAATFAARIDSRMDRIIYERALEEDPDDYHLRTRFGHYLLENGLTGEAIEQFRWITDTFPEFEGGHQDLGLAFLIAERHEEARASFERVLEIRPRYARARKALELVRERAP